MITAVEFLGVPAGVHLVTGSAGAALYDLRQRKVWALPRPLADLLEQCGEGLTLNEALMRTGLPSASMKLFRQFIDRHPALEITHEYKGPPEPLPVVQILDYGLLMVEITDACNLRCCHCYSEALPAPSKGGRVRLTTARWLELLAEAREIGYRWLQITGGEPTTHPDLPIFLRRAHDLGFESVALFTNLHDLPEDLLRLLQETGSEVHTSVYSHLPEVHDSVTGRAGSFQRMAEGVRRALAAGLDVHASFVLMDRNSGASEETIRFIESLGISNHHIRVGSVMPMGRGIDLPESQAPPLWARRISDWTIDDGALVMRTCWSGRTAITVVGDVYVCVGERTVMGNVADAPLRPIAEGPEMERLWSLTLDDVPECSDCEFRFGCFDCRADAHVLSKSLVGRDPTCPYDPRTGRWNYPGNEIAMDAKPKRREGLAAEDMDGGLMVADFQDAQLHVLNPVAAVIWEMCNGEISVDGIIAALASHFNAAPEQIRLDVERTLGEFRAKKLIE